MSQQWSFYHSETGLFVDLLHSGPPGSEMNVTPPGCVPIPGHHDRNCKRVNVETGEVVDYQPSQPSKHHEWDGRRWRLTATAQQAQAAEASALVALAAADVRRVRALSDHALGIPGADQRLAAIEAECVPHREALAAAREALKQ